MWYLNNQRDLPWRNSRDPYFIWLSEVILQQTRIDQGTVYYEKFTREFADIFALAEAEEKTILKLWQGLGYYSRARNLHHTAKQIAEEYQGHFPSSHAELMKLKGIGDYTASAIASIAFNQPHAVVDGNVYRVLSRFFGIHTPINETKGIKEFKLLAEELLDPKDPGTHNQALMEFGALVCTPAKPKCSSCELQNACYALQKGLVNQLPVKLKKLKIKKRYFNYFVFDTLGGGTRIRQRKQRDIWQHLYEFPLYESAHQIQHESELQEYIASHLNITGTYAITRYNEAPVVHKLTHQTLYASFWIVEPAEDQMNMTSWNELEKLALPVLLQNFVDKYTCLN